MDPALSMHSVFGRRKGRVKVLLLNPPFKNGKFSRTSRSPAITKSGTLYYPIWLAYAAGVLEKEDFEVKLLDAPARGLTRGTCARIADDYKPDLVVMDTSTPSIYSDVEMAEAIKDNVKDAFLVLVGTHPSVLPQETLRLSGSLDAVARGEYDYTIRDLAKALDSDGKVNSISGLSYRNGDSIIENKRRPFIEDLDALPFASSVYKRHLNIKDYFFAASHYPFVMIVTGRGCPFGCTFCLYPQVFHSRRYRFRSPANVADEFEYVIKDLPEVKEIGIEDDTFAVSEERAREICEALIKRNLRISWYANARADLDFETMRMMKRAGCRLVIVGFESGSQEILDNIHKDLKVEGMVRFKKNAERAGILVHGCFMIGNPGEREETAMETIDFAERLNCDTAQFFPLMAYPGTEAYDWAVKKGYITAGSFSEWLTPDGLHNAVINTENLSAEDLVRLCDYARRRFYLRPGYIRYKLLRSFTSPGEFVRTVKSFRTFYRYLV